MLYMVIVDGWKYLGYATLAEATQRIKQAIKDNQKYEFYINFFSYTF